MALTYYAPYVSGLSEAARLLAEDIVRRGHDVTIATTRHEDDLPEAEIVAGVHVRRARVAAHVGKGTVSLHFPALVRRLAHHADVLNLHLPLLEAGLLARLASSTPVVTTYQCDVNLSNSFLDRAQVAVIDASSRSALRQSRVVAVSSQDYARSSRVWPAMAGRAVEIAPPCVRRPLGRPTMRRGPGRHFGFLGRMVEEKGVEHLVEAFLRVAEPSDRLLLAGDYLRVAGGTVVDQIRQRIGDDPRVTLLGFLPNNLLGDFYASLDVFVLPSVNSLEAFGIVQVEAMLAGVPVIASDLPGVREPVRRTGFGVVVPPGDVIALAQALRNRPTALSAMDGAARASEQYGLSATTDAYLDVFAAVAGEGRRRLRNK